MMRIIAGKYRHKLLTWPDDADYIRPTKDRIRESIFSALGNINGTSVLDLYAGSGAMGIEALSRGSTSATFVDNNQVSITTVNKNIKSVGVKEQTEVLKMNDFDALNSFINNEQFDIVFLDPPYKEGRYDELLNTLINNDILTKNGIVVVETDRNLSLQTQPFKKIKEYHYGKINVYILWR